MKYLALLLIPAALLAADPAPVSQQPDYQALAVSYRIQVQSLSDQLADAQGKLLRAAAKVQDLTEKVADRQKQVDAAKPKAAKPAVKK